MKSIKQIIKSRQGELKAKKGVVGVGRGMKNGNSCVTVLVEKKKPFSQLSSYDVVPKKVNGIKTDVIEVGHLKALSYKKEETAVSLELLDSGVTTLSELIAQQNTARVRPIRPGFSIGHKDITAGTAGAVVFASDGSFILSNNHVLANSNLAQIGDEIVQPGPIDGGTLPNDLAGNLEDFERILFDGDIPPDPPSDCWFAKSVTSTFNAVCEFFGSRTRYRAVRPEGRGPDQTVNLVDAAIMRPAEGIILDPSIAEIGVPSSTPALPAVGMKLQKSGRTTGLTKFEVVAVDATVTVDYGAQGSATFEDQIVTTFGSEGGDSGSLVVTDDENRNPVGLLFAGSSQSIILNEIGHVMELLDVHF